MQAVDGRLLVPNGSLTLHAHSVVHAVSIVESRIGTVPDTKRLAVHKSTSTCTSASTPTSTPTSAPGAVSAATSQSIVGLCPPPSVGCPSPVADTVQHVELALQGRSACLVAGAPVVLRSGRLRAVGRIVRLGTSAAQDSSAASALATSVKNTAGYTEKAGLATAKADSEMTADGVDGITSQVETLHLLNSDSQVVKTSQSENNNHHIPISISLLNLQASSI